MEKENKFGTMPVPKLLMSLAIPAVIANVVNALYNIVDQIFIGNKIGEAGNAATSIAFPLTIVCLAIGLMFGLGSAAGFNLELGRKNQNEAKKYAGTAFTSLLISGVVICALVQIFLKPLMILFGANDEAVLEYAMEYSSITSFGIPFLLFSLGTNPLVRGDGSATYSMISIVVGALINVGLDALFMLVFDWGMAGAAWATIIGQIVSAIILAAYFFKFGKKDENGERHGALSKLPSFKNVSFTKSDFIPRMSYVGKICKLGFASFIFQSSMIIVQVLLNNLLGKYGDLSVYGGTTAQAVAGILSKVNAIYIALIIGVVQGSQPICSFNYGARKFDRVKKTVKLLLSVTTVISVIFFAVIWIFPRQIVGIFGSEDELYFEFAEIYARGFTACLFLNGIQISASTFFPSIGKAGKGAIISLTKQIIILVPLMIILPLFMGLNGVIYATPITDACTFVLAVALFIYEMKHMPKQNEI